MQNHVTAKGKRKTKTIDREGMARCLCVHQTAVQQKQEKLAAQVGT